MRRILREPLAHFLAIGALMFAVYAVVSGQRNRDPGTIEVGQGQVDTMSAVFERTWQRAPTPDEVKGLIDGYVREEVLYREGVAMGLDRNDQLIRRRVGQKVEFLAESMNGVPEPSDAVLQAYLDGHRERFASPVIVTFRQVYLGTAADMGRPTQLDARMDSAPPGDIARTFGRRFAQSLAATPEGTWTGPIASDYGLHLVRVSERVEPRTPALDEVRETVKREWQRETLAGANEKYYEGLRARYAVRIENPRVALAQ